MRHQPSQRITNIARHLDGKGFIRNFFQFPGRAYIVALMWPKEARLFPVSYFREVIPLCFDCWPTDYDRWAGLFKRHNIKTAFFTARQSQEYFQKRMPEMRSCWMPEAADPAEYPFQLPLSERSIDVMELGRRFEKYHSAIKEPLVQAGRKHLFVQDARRRMFDTREELMDGWKRTKISICFPKSITDRERSGGVETVTFRYFESMASRCLVVGHCPAELSELFGYNPVIQIDWRDPGAQLLSILDRMDEYQSLVEKNYRRMLEVGSWEVRAETMLSYLESCSYVI